MLPIVVEVCVIILPLDHTVAAHVRFSINIENTRHLLSQLWHGVLFQIFKDNYPSTLLHITLDVNVKTDWILKSIWNDHYNSVQIGTVFMYAIPKLTKLLVRGTSAFTYLVSEVNLLFESSVRQWAVYSVLVNPKSTYSYKLEHHQAPPHLFSGVQNAKKADPKIPGLPSCGISRDKQQQKD